MERQFDPRLLDSIAKLIALAYSGYQKKLEQLQRLGGDPDLIVTIPRGRRTGKAIGLILSSSHRLFTIHLGWANPAVPYDIGGKLKTFLQEGGSLPELADLVEAILDAIDQATREIEEQTRAQLASPDITEAITYLEGLAFSERGI